MTSWGICQTLMDLILLARMVKPPPSGKIGGFLILVNQTMEKPHLQVYFGEHRPRWILGIACRVKFFRNHCKS